MANVAPAELRFLIHKDSLYINTNNDSPVHTELAYLLGMLTKEVALQILHTEPRGMIDKTYQLIGQAILGGYCTKITDTPLTFKYVKGSTSLVPAEKEDFEKAQQAGKVVFDNHSANDMYKSDLYLP